MSTRTSKEQRLADLRRGQLTTALDMMLIAVYQLGVKHGRDEALREQKTAKKSQK